ncbi:MAG: sigma-54-dependent transcriptional regulator, partial [Balneolaceae bacterium]
MTKTIFLIDDDANILNYMNDHLVSNSYQVEAFTSARKALKNIKISSPDLVITDVKMDEMTGDDVLNHIRKHHPGTGVILITGFGNISHSVNAMRKGAFDYITKPFTGKEFLHRIEQFFQHKSQKKVSDKSSPNDPDSNGQYFKASVPESENKRQVETSSRHIMIGENAKIKHLIDILRQIAPTNAPVLIQGESGTGKEVYASMIHQNSDRANKPFIKINCANLPTELVESTLFGHEKGSFTGAIDE